MWGQGPALYKHNYYLILRIGIGNNFCTGFPLCSWSIFSLDCTNKITKLQSLAGRNSLYRKYASDVAENPANYSPISSENQSVRRKPASYRRECRTSLFRFLFLQTSVLLQAPLDSRRKIPVSSSC